MESRAQETLMTALSRGFAGLLEIMRNRRNHVGISDVDIVTLPDSSHSLASFYLYSIDYSATKVRPLGQVEISFCQSQGQEISYDKITYTGSDPYNLRSTVRLLAAQTSNGTEDTPSIPNNIPERPLYRLDRFTHIPLATHERIHVKGVARDAYSHAA